MSKENRQRQLSIKGELTDFLLYRSPNGEVKIEVLLYDETIWLPQKQIAELFGVQRPAITKHLKNIFDSGELMENSVCSILEHTAGDGKKYQTKYYNLDVIISVGYRVKSKQGTQFRIWAEKILAKNEGQVLTPKVLSSNEIASKIYDVRGMPVMLDRDLAVFYKTETRTLKQAVKRNIGRFPSDFMFVLDNNDIESMVSQSVIPSSKYFGGAKPYAFTEQGVAMLSAVIRTPVAVEISLKIIRTFIAIKNLAFSKFQTQKRLDTLEIKQLETDEKLNQLFDAIDKRNDIPKQGIFFDGQIFDAYAFVCDIIKQAKKSVVLIDNYVDETVLILLSKRNKKVKATIYTKPSKQLGLDLKKHNQQYSEIAIKKLTRSHDRFIILDEKIVYHFGASLKDLGRKWFAFSKMEQDASEILNKLEANE